MYIFLNVYALQNLLKKTTHTGQIAVRGSFCRNDSLVTISFSIHPFSHSNLILSVLGTHIQYNAIQYIAVSTILIHAHIFETKAINRMV